ncbi:YktB family protein [Bacillus sp. AK128]
MTFSGFQQEDFQTFSIEGLDERMEAIKENIQPKFREIGAILTNDLSAFIGNEMYLHIAKHARRTVNPPKDTWLAIAHDKRGYKKHPHFQVGLFDDHVFVWLAYIYELPNKAEMASKFLGQADEVFNRIPKDYVISQDHMKKDSISIDGLSETEFEAILNRFKDVKKAEFLVGKKINSNDPILKDGEEFINMVRDTYQTLLPIYKLSLR